MSNTSVTSPRLSTLALLGLVTFTGCQSAEPEASVADLYSKGQYVEASAMAKELDSALRAILLPKKGGAKEGEEAHIPEEAEA